MIKRNKNRKKIVLMGGLLVVTVALAVAVAYARHSDTSTSVNTPAGSGKNITNKTGRSDVSNKNTAEQISNKYPSGNANASSVNVITPNGTFVNNYNPKMTDSMLSICATTPNISCQIAFTRNGITHSLPSQTTDETGNTVWSWTPKSEGLTAGTWKVVVTATAGTKSVTVNDPIALEVQ